MKPYIPALVWLLIILLLSGYPGSKMPELPVWQIDKFVHTAIYFILSVFLLLAFHRQYRDLNKRLLLMVKVVLFGVLYGGAMEVFQDNIFINRDGNWYDFSANVIGTISGVLMYPPINKYLPIAKWLKIN